MEKQQPLINYDKELQFENINYLRPNKNSLENEKKNFIEVMSSFVDSIDLDEKQSRGRPRFSPNEIIKSLLIMCYHGMSYRRAESDLNELKEKGIIREVPKRSTLNKYVTLEETKKIFEKLIQLSSLFFIDDEDTLILDSTWLATRMYSGGYRRVYDKKSTPLGKCRKLHVACLKNSRIIACAKTSIGTKHDSAFFKDLIMSVVKNGFTITKLLADAGYSGKENYVFCQTLNIREVFIDFKKNAILKRPKSSTWRKQLTIFKENPEQWHESYRFRVLVEGVFSAIKRKHTNYLRSRLEISQDIELLLKCLVYNFTVIGRFS